MRRKRTDSLQERCLALNFAIRKGVTIKANIKGTMCELISIKNEPTGITFLFHDEHENLCMFLVAPGQEIELFVSLGSEVRA